MCWVFCLLSGVWCQPVSLGDAYGPEMDRQVVLPAPGSAGVSHLSQVKGKKAPVKAVLVRAGFGPACYLDR